MRERRPRGNNWEKKIPPRFFPSLSLFLSVFLWLLLSSSPLCITASFLTVMSASGARREQRGGGQYFRELECLKYTQRFSSSGWSVQISPVTPFPLGNTHTPDTQQVLNQHVTRLHTVGSQIPDSLTVSLSKELIFSITIKESLELSFASPDCSGHNFCPHRHTGTKKVH